MAKILIYTYTMYGAWFSIRLQQEGHSVDIFLDEKISRKHSPNYKYLLQGLIKQPLLVLPDFKKYDLVIFDMTGKPKVADECIKLGIPCFGDGTLNSELEDNRLFGIEVMEACEIPVPVYEKFDNINEAKRFIRKTNKRYVFKPFDDLGAGNEQDTSSTYVSKDAEDLLRYLDRLGTLSKGASFLLQEVVNGTEISTEGYFNGEEFFLIAGTLEEKKFMNGRIGPNTGCSGNLEFIYDQQNPPYIFREGLGKTKDFLKQYGYRGYLDLNTIVTDTKLYGLEWTPRFGYDCTATHFACIRSDIGDFLGAISSGVRPEYEVSNIFSTGIRLSIPPYPTETNDKEIIRSEVPIQGIEEDDIPKNCFLYDCYLDKSDALFTVGINGFIGVPIQAGGTIQEAFGILGERVKKIDIPDLQYRTDIEDCCIKRYKILAQQGWLR